MYTHVYARHNAQFMANNDCLFFNLTLHERLQCPMSSSYKQTIKLIDGFFFFLLLLHLDSQKLDSCNEGGLNLISKNNNNHSNNNRNRTTSSNYIINNNELPSSDDIDPIAIKSERVVRSSSRSHCETEIEKLEEPEKTDDEFETDQNDEENEGDNNNNENDEHEGEICENDAAKSVDDKSKLYKKKKRRRRKRELTLKSDQSQQIEDDDDEMTTMKHSPIADDNDGNLSDSYINRKHSVSISRRRHSSSSDPVNLSIGNKQSQQDDSDEANIDVETISNAPTKVNLNFNYK